MCIYCMGAPVAISGFDSDYVFQVHNPVLRLLKACKILGKLLCNFWIIREYSRIFSIFENI